MVRPSCNADDRDDDLNNELRYRQLALINPPEITAASAAGGSVFTSRYTDFTLPEGWRVEEVPRTSSSTVDKYYYEPETGRKFRSLRAVERYVNGEDVQFYTNPLAVAWRNSKKRPFGSGHSRKRIIFDGKWDKRVVEVMAINMILVNQAKEMVNYMEGMSESELASLAARKKAAKSHYNLPDGWVVEEVPRRHGSIYGPHTDKYYYEPESGMKFRSLTTAWKYVAESNEYKPLAALVAEIKDSNMPLARAFKLPESLKKQASYMKKPTTRNDEQLPERVEWVIDSIQENAWKPFVCGQAVPPSLIKEWRERFHQAMHTGTD